MTLPFLVFALAFVPMLFEARLSARNDRGLRAGGALEPSNDVYPLMQIAYPTSFAAMVLESWLRGAAAGTAFFVGAAIFVSAKALKYWAIVSLGRRWTFRVLVPPAASLVSSGPYRILRHPNYIAVMGELAGMALMCGAVLTGPVALAVFSLIVLARIRIEERALGLRVESSNGERAKTGFRR